MAWITKDDLKPYFTDELSSINWSDADRLLIDNIINYVCEYVENYTGCKFSQQNVVEFLDGNDTNMLFLSYYPVIQINNIWYDLERKFDSSTLIDLDNIFLDTRKGCIIYNSGIFANLPSVVKVDYIAGYQTVPSDIKQVACEMVFLSFDKVRKRELNVVNVTGFRENVTFITDIALLPRHREVLDKYVRIKL